MFFRRCASLVLALVVSACASSPDASFGEEGGTPTRTARGNPNLIVRAELEQTRGQSAWQAVSTVRPRWLRAQRSSSVTTGPFYARVVTDGAFRGDLSELHRFNVSDIEFMRYLSAADATTRYGTGYPGGVIEVSTRGRR